MAKVFYSPGIDLVLGALDPKHELINRQKHLHNPDGSVSKTCKPEVYLWREKRNYELNPPKGAELAHSTRNSSLKSKISINRRQFAKKSIKK